MVNSSIDRSNINLAAQITDKQKSKLSLSDYNKCRLTSLVFTGSLGGL